MRRVEDYMSPASLDDYITWVVTERLFMDRSEFDEYSRLVNVLIGIEFVWDNPRDKNRAADGLALREDFTYETGLYLDKSSGLMPGCTFFEMLVALAYRIEHQFMLDLNVGYRVSRWWFLMIKNLGFEELTDDKWTRDDANYICDVVEKFMHRIYKNSGPGCLFPIKNRKIVARDEEIWKQCMVYINENFA